MGPAVKLLNVRQGERWIEDYARDFMGVARQSAMENTCLVFWGGLAEPFRSRMLYWVPVESLEDYINLALNLSDSAFRVELAVEPAQFREPTESAPETALFRESTESAPEPAPFREPTESAPEPAPFREPTESAPEPAQFREPTESAPGAQRVSKKGLWGSGVVCSRSSCSTSTTLAPVSTSASRPSSSTWASPSCVKHSQESVLS